MSRRRWIPSLVLMVLLSIPLPGWAQSNCLDAPDGDPECAVYVDNDGNVGVGTTQPVALLDVRGPIYLEGSSGDVNGDGSININDVLAISNVLNGTTTPTPAVLAGADVNGDGKVSLDDIGVVILIWQGASKLAAVQSIGGKYGMPYPDTFQVGADVEILGTLEVDEPVTIGSYGSEASLTVFGPIYQRYNLIHADYVFAPDYELESIEEHADYMWREKHLKAVPGHQVDEAGLEVLEVGAHRRGILEELEKAHIYIAQLNEKIKQQANERAELAELRARMARFESAFEKLEAPPASGGPASRP